MNQPLVRHPSPATIIADGVSARTSLRRLLNLLGITDAEMRLRPGGRSVLDGWTGEEQTLLDLAHRRWKQLAKIHHEASGNNIDQWRTANSIHAVVSGRIKKYIRKKKTPTKYVQCACGCGRWFKRDNPRRKYHSLICNNRMKQTRRMAGKKRCRPMLIACACGCGIYVLRTRSGATAEKYATDRCYNQSMDRKYWAKHKDSPEFKRRQSETRKRWQARKSSRGDIGSSPNGEVSAIC